MRLIDADAFVQFLKDTVIRQKYENLEIDGLLTVADVIEAIISDLDGTSFVGFKNAPTIEPETEEEAYERGYTAGQMAYRKTGRWIKKRYWSEGVGMGESYGYWYACSECNHEVKGGYGGCSDRFCLNCGAAMTEEGEQDA